MHLSFRKVLSVLALAAAAAGCSAGGGGSTPSTAVESLVISGSLASSYTASALKPASLKQSLTLSDLEIYAIAFTSPPVIAQADVNADGSFSVALPGAKGASITAVFRDTANAGSVVGTVEFKDTSNKDLNGEAKSSSSIVLADTVNLGNLSISDDGTVVVDVATIATAVAAPAAAATAFDMSGVWRMSAFSPLPTGYTTTCAAGTPHNECEALPDQSEIALIRLGGKLFTPASGQCDRDANPVVCASTDGTVTTTQRYAMAVWEASGFAACGSKTGFTEAEARAGGSIHIEDALPTVGGVQVGFGDFTGYNPYFWVKSAATATRDTFNCKGMDVTVGSSTYKAYACKGDILDNSSTDTGNDGWQVNLGQGGCRDTSNRPVMVTNWGSLTPSASCTNTTTGLPDGFTSGSCPYTGDPDGSGPATSTSFVCTWTGGSFTDNAGAPNLAVPVTSGYRVGPPSVLVASGAACGNQTDGSGTGLTLQEAQCYADYFFQNQGTSGACDPQVQFNWSADTIENFYRVDYRGKPKSQFLLDILTYNAGGDLATLDTEEHESFTIASGASSTVTCETARKIVFNFRKLTETTATVEVRFAGRMASTAPACQGLAKRAIENVEFNKTADNASKRRAIDTGDLEHIFSSSSLLMSATKQ